MPVSCAAAMRRVACVVLVAGTAGAAWGQWDPPVQPVHAEGDYIPKHPTAAEQAYMDVFPTIVERGPGTAPTGPLSCPGEYHPAAGIVFAWEPWNTSIQTILITMIRNVTTVGNADAVICVDTQAEQTSVTTTLTTAGGVNMSRVRFVVVATDSIWIRDYGPRFTYEGGVRVIPDHTYNYAAGRPNDNMCPIGFANTLGFMRYTHPISHGGGNFHLNSLGQGNATVLLNSDNPGMTSAQIIASFQQFWGVNTYLHSAFRTTIDGTRHIDMWMQVIADDRVMVSNFPLATNNNTALPEDVICDNVATNIMPGLGYQVFRVPAFGGTSTTTQAHYTYTNTVMCNDLVLIPSYTNSVVAPYNAQALTAWQSALPTKQIVQVPCEAIVTAAGVMHCIVMHLPVNSGGQNPVAYVKGPNAGGAYNPGDVVSVTWLSDDDVDVTNIDVELSIDNGQSWQPIAMATADDRQQNWTVPDVYTTQGVIRVTARDADGRTGSDTTDALFTINGTQQPPPCPADHNGVDGVTVQDIYDFLAQWNFGNPTADFNGVDGVTVQDIYDFLAAWNAGCP